MPTVVVVFLAALLGLAVGSFLNVVASRVPNGERLTGRSHCPHCGRTLAARDLAPLVSFVLLAGRCRSCHRPIARRYAVVELATALLFAGAVLRFGLTPAALWLAGVGAFAIVLFVMDLERQVVPDRVSLPAAAAGLGLGFLAGRGFTDLLLGGILGAGFFALQYVLSRGRWVGDGDIRLGAFVGLSVGFRDSVVALVLAYGAGALVALGLLAARRAGVRSRLPFGAFLMAALVVAALAGGPIAAWYLNGGPFHAFGLDRLTDWVLARLYDL